MNSNLEFHPHEDHLRFLLDQRAARADLHGRFPSQSDFSDSPSLYSHAHFSPQSHSFDHNPHEPSSSFLNYPPAHSRMHSAELRSPSISDRDRLNYPDASSLDLDDDRHSSYDYPPLHEEDEDSPGLSSDPADEDLEEHRVSAYGPKMTFHSRAPWETGEDDHEHQTTSAKTKKRSDKQPKSDQPKRTWTLVSRSSSEARPSMESLRPQAKPKQSFDTVSSISSNGGALLALAQASMSSTSLGIAPSPQSSLRDKLSLPRLRSRTTSNTRVLSKLEPLDTRPMTPNPPPNFPSHASPMSRFRTTSPSDSVFSRIDRQTISGPPSPHTPQHDYKHPYANPELVRDFPTETSSQQHLDELHALAHSPSTFSPSVGRSDSNATLTDTHTTSSISHSSTSTTVSLTPVNSLSSVPSKTDSLPSPRSPFALKNISAPIPVNRATIRTLPGTIHGGMNVTSSSLNGINSKRDTKLLPGVPVGVPGWGENSGAKTIKLISLEEAQARERTRSATVNASSGTASPTSNRAVEYEPLPSPSAQSGTGWSRIRSTSSSSSRPKNLPTPPGTDVGQLYFPVSSDGVSSDHGSINGLGAKSIVRKKSGFMRLFNGNKERSPPPPMPMISTNVVVSSSPSALAPRKGSTHRVPVPSITPSLLDPPNSAGSHSSSGDSRSDRDSPASSAPSRGHSSAGSARKNVHGLSIVTSSPSTVSLSEKPHHRSASPSASDATHIPTTPTTGPSSTEENPILLVPSSAPPTSAEFVGLKLRPVSTMFSTGFSTQFATRSSADQSRPSLDVDSGTPTTSTSAISPLSPAFVGGLQPRASEDKAMSVSIATHHEDQSTVIQALQEQIATSRRAWQRQIWELEGQVRDLKAEVEELRATDNANEYCVACGRGNVGRPEVDGEARVVEDLRKAGVRVGGVVNRPRARTGVGSRFASGT